MHRATATGSPTPRAPTHLPVCIDVHIRLSLAKSDAVVSLQTLVYVRLDQQQLVHWSVLGAQTQQVLADALDGLANGDGLALGGPPKGRPGLVDAPHDGLKHRPISVGLPSSLCVRPIRLVTILSVALVAIAIILAISIHQVVARSDARHHAAHILPLCLPSIRRRRRVGWLASPADPWRALLVLLMRPHEQRREGESDSVDGAAPAEARESPPVEPLVVGGWVSGGYVAQEKGLRRHGARRADSISASHCPLGPVE
mmetsp:Transcript_16573/g.47210  ORF Transcript_16573/g.47210 Transcript_16573/m.47210 type:complete len:257 (-) Transcript_16573:1004-1774(-)